MGPQGPIVNGVPIDQSAPRQVTPTKESHVLNDAIVAAALDLRKRDRSRRKVIFIISDGREYRSNASYKRYPESLALKRNSGLRRGRGGLRYPGDTARCRSCTSR